MTLGAAGFVKPPKSHDIPKRVQTLGSAVTTPPVAKPALLLGIKDAVADLGIGDLQHSPTSALPAISLPYKNNQAHTYSMELLPGGSWKRAQCQTHGSAATEPAGGCFRVPLSPKTHTLGPGFGGQALGLRGPREGFWDPSSHPSSSSQPHLLWHLGTNSPLLK